MKMVHERCQVMRERYVQDGLLVTVKADPRMAATLEPYRCDVKEGLDKKAAESEK